MTLTSNIQGQIWNYLYLSQKWFDCHGMNSKQLIWTWPEMWSLCLTWALNFQGQILNLLYHMTKWSHCHEMKNEGIDWTPDLKCRLYGAISFEIGEDLDLLIFKVFFLNSCISGMVKQKGLWFIHDIRHRCAVDSSSFVRNCWLQYVISLHCSYCWHGALAPRHQWPQS